MRRKVLGILVCILFIATLVPVTSATNENGAKPLITLRHWFPTCYINATGLIYNVMIKSLFFGQFNNHGFAVTWLCQWDGFNTTIPTTVTIYSEKGGEVLWTNEGQNGIWALKMFFYRGVYTYEETPDGRPIVHLEGKATLAVTLNDL
jgi:hypothetical protein